MQEAPTLWDVDFDTAVAQAELEDRERPGAYHTLAFHLTSGKTAEGKTDILIDTTRPELLPACVALVAHPDDERYQPLFGSTVTTPVFGVEVPVLAHPLAEPDTPAVPPPSVPPLGGATEVAPAGWAPPPPVDAAASESLRPQASARYWATVSPTWRIPRAKRTRS